MFGSLSTKNNWEAWFSQELKSEPQHDKTNKWPVRPVKTRISLGIHPVWSALSLCTQWVAKDSVLLQADSKDSDQTGRMPRLIWVFAGCTGHFVGFVMHCLKSLCTRNSDLNKNLVKVKHWLIQSSKQKTSTIYSSYEAIFKNTTQ